MELNRAVALAMAFGPAVGLELVDSLVSEGSLEGYHLLPSVRGDLLAKLDRFDEARTEFERAASLTRNTRERELILERATACRRGPGGPLGDHARLARGAFSPNRARSSHASRG